MFIYYVKAQDQSLESAKARAGILNCSTVLEDTSTGVDPSNQLPHVICQDERGVTTVFIEPADRADIDALELLELQNPLD